MSDYSNFSCEPMQDQHTSQTPSPSPKRGGAKKIIALALCCALNVDAQQALERVLEKYEARLRKKGSAGSR